MKNTQLIAICALAASVSTTFSSAWAHSDAGHAGHMGAQNHATPTPAQQSWGKPGQASAVQRSITLRMTDDMRFTPAQFSVQQGETVRLHVVNDGQLMHEVLLGNAASLAEHAQLMRQSPHMAHGDASMAHVAPGQSKDLIWTFNRSGQFDFACLIAGHYEAGMRGRFSVNP